MGKNEKGRRLENREGGGGTEGGREEGKGRGEEQEEERKRRGRAERERREKGRRKYLKKVQ